MPQHTLPSRQEHIRGDEAAGFGIVVAGLEVVEACLLVVNVAPVAEGVQCAQCGCQGAGAAQGLAPAVIGVFYHGVPVAVNQLDNVPLAVAQDETSKEDRGGPPLFLFVFAAAVLVLLAAAAGAGIVAAHLDGVHEDLGGPIGLGDLVALLLGQDALPLRQVEEPVGFGFVHVEEKLLKVKVEGDFAVLGEGFEVLLAVGEGGVGPVEVPHESHGIHAHFLGQSLHRAGQGLVVVQKDLLVDLGLLGEIVAPILLIGSVALQVLRPCLPFAVQTHVSSPFSKLGLF